MKKATWCVVLCLSIGLGPVQAQDLKIDFSQTNGPVQEGYQAYVADHEVSATFTAQEFEAFGATVTVLPTWTSDATDAAMQMIDRGGDDGTEVPALVRDWIGTDGRQPGDPMTLTITGLPSGTYEWVSLHDDPQDQTGIFDVTVNDAGGSTTTTGIDISDISTLLLADMTTFTTTIVSNGTDPVSLVFTRTSPAGDSTITTTFFLMNSFELTALNIGGATFPGPANQATDVLRDGTVLSWVAASDAVSHDVYFGTDHDDVADATTADSTYVRRQSETSFDPAPLGFGRTYYWRVDEVTSDGTVTEGSVWSFTVEPVAYLLTDVTATASHPGDPAKGPENTVDGSGLSPEGQHSVDDPNMWLAEPAEGESVWIQFDFDRVYKLAETQIWNHNTLYEFILGFGFQDITIEYAADGNDWTALGDFQLVRGPGLDTYEGQTIDLNGIAAKSVRINAVTNYGGDSYGLSEVQFSYIPTYARTPQPESGATDVDPDTVLSWRAGREAASHEVHLGTDSNAVAEGSALVDTATASSYAPAFLELAQTYYWRIGEVNEAETPASWAGGVWNFSTPEYLVVDDFESYTDDVEAGQAIFLTWEDGYNVGGNGSQVGHDDLPYAEETIVHSGNQSMPFYYGKDGETVSEATRSFETAQDWTRAGAQTLVAYFRGTLGNAAGQLYVEINGTRFNYDGSAESLAAPVWKQWNIDVASLGNAARNVTSMVIGVSGSGEGRLYVDDLRLYRSAPSMLGPAVDPGTANLAALYAMENNLNDGSGNGLGGTAQVGAEFGQGPTGYGNALVLDGVSGYAELPIGSLIASLDSVTVAGWVDWSGTDTWQRIFDFGNDTDVYMFMTPQSGSGLRFAITTSSSGGESQVTAGGSALPSGWHHVAATIDGATGEMVLYLDGGVADSGTTATLPSDLGSTTQNWIGRSQWDDPYFNGSIDDFRIYDRALSEAEVRYLVGDR